MKKEDFSVGMIVKFGADRFGHDNMARGVIIKINPKLARVKSLEQTGKWPAGAVWRCPYRSLVPVVGGSEVSNEMTMRSFQNPNDTAVKAWSARQKSMESVPKSLKAEDKHIMRAIHEIYQRLDKCGVRERNELSVKISLLFRAIGREVPKDEVEEWMLERTHA
jgi:hypothetical protein